MSSATSQDILATSQTTRVAKHVLTEECESSLPSTQKFQVSSAPLCNKDCSHAKYAWALCVVSTGDQTKERSTPFE
jgi:hypothetical protein